MTHSPSADILENFDTQHPLVLPDGGYQFHLGREVTDSALWQELDKLKEFISTLSHSNKVSATEDQKVQTMAFVSVRFYLHLQSWSRIYFTRKNGYVKQCMKFWNDQCVNWLTDLDVIQTWIRIMDQDQFFPPGRAITQQLMDKFPEILCM